MSSTAGSEDTPAIPSRWSGIVPAGRWLRTYQPSWLRADLAAGVTLAAYLLPAALGYASLAGSAAGGRALRLSVRRAGLLAVLQLAADFDHRHVADLAAYRFIARRLRWW